MVKKKKYKKNKIKKNPAEGQVCRASHWEDRGGPDMSDTPPACLNPTLLPTAPKLDHLDPSLIPPPAQASNNSL